MVSLKSNLSHSRISRFGYSCIDRESSTHQALIRSSSGDTIPREEVVNHYSSDNFARKIGLTVS